MLPPALSMHAIFLALIVKDFARIFGVIDDLIARSAFSVEDIDSEIRAIDGRSAEMLFELLSCR